MVTANVKHVYTLKFESDVNYTSTHELYHDNLFQNRREESGSYSENGSIVKIKFKTKGLMEEEKEVEVEYLRKNDLLISHEEPIEGLPKTIYQKK